MTDLIKEYFHNVDNYTNEFYLGATAEEILNLENQLTVNLPIDFRDFLLSTNGFEGFVNDFFVRFSSVEQIIENTKDYCEEFFPWAVYIGTNGGAEMVVIDKRQTPFQFGLLPYIADDDDFIALGDTFEKLIFRLYNDTAFKKDESTDD